MTGLQPPKRINEDDDDDDGDGDGDDGDDNDVDENKKFIVVFIACDYYFYKWNKITMLCNSSI